MSDTALSEAEGTAQSVPREAAETLAQRSTHGEAVENHRHIASGWTWVLKDKLDSDITAREVAVCMQMVKLSRSITGQVVKDHDVDVCGYAGIAWACAVVDGQAVMGDD